MAVALLAFDDTANGGTAVTSLTTGAFDGSGSDRAVVAFIGNSDASPAAPTSVTWDVATPENLAQQVTLSALTYYRASLWGLKGQTSATDTITANWASAQDDVVLIGHSFTGVDQTTPFGNTQSGSGTSAEPSETLTDVASDDMCIDGVFYFPEGSATPGADQTLRGSGASGTPYINEGHTSTQPGTAGGAMTWTLSGTPSWIHVALVIKGSVVGGATRRYSLTLTGVG